MKDEDMIRMIENNAVNGNSLLSIMSGISNGDKCFVILMVSLVSAYWVKRYFDSTDKAMEHGYNTNVIFPKYGAVKFERSHDGEYVYSKTSCSHSTSEEPDD